jgi:hypothetical protein
MYETDLETGLPRCLYARLPSLRIQSISQRLVEVSVSLQAVMVWPRKYASRSGVEDTRSQGRWMLYPYSKANAALMLEIAYSYQF